MESNPRGIPKAPFIEDVAGYVQDSENAEAALKSLQELLAKYRFMESNANQRKTNMSGKLVEFEETLQVLASLVSRGDLPVDSSFELSDTLYAKATIPPVERVHLWLGANVMLSYEIEEAQLLLQDKQRTASQGYANALDDLDWLREQITVTEVNIARVYNWDVKARRSSQG